MKVLNANVTKSCPCYLKIFPFKQSLSTISKISEILDKFLNNCKNVLQYHRVEHFKVEPFWHFTKYQVQLKTCARKGKRKNNNRGILIQWQDIDVLLLCIICSTFVSESVFWYSILVNFQSNRTCQQLKQYEKYLTNF